MTLRLFQHYVPSAFLWLGIAEFSLFLSSMYGGYWLRFYAPSPLPDSDFLALFPTAVFFAGTLIITNIAVGLYQRRLREGIPGIAIRVTTALALSLLPFSMVFYAFDNNLLGRGVLIISLAIAYVSSLALRGVFITFLVDRSILKRRILVLGAGDRAARINEFRRKSDRRTFKIIGFVPMNHDSVSEDLTPTISLQSSLAELVKEHRIDELLVAADDRRDSLPLEDILTCKMRGVEVTDLLTFFEREHGIIKLDILQPSWLIFSEGFRQSPLKTGGKRLLDILASLALLSIAWPFIALGALAIIFESGLRQPILFSQIRVGQHGEPFRLFKFRSMRTDAEADGVARWASKDDPRVTRVGNFLRRTRIDELPQLFNVFNGDMSFVGPRPERPEFVDKLKKGIPHYQERHRMKPGITGWAQICYPYGASEKDAYRKLQYDLYYVKNFNIFFDLWILIQTGEVILWGRGVR